jgi:eukaryotic-like serine/threonine-protein kinase
MEDAAHDPAAASGGVGLGDYLLYPEQPLAALSVGRNLAYRAVSRERPERACFALVCDPASRPRLDVMDTIRKVASPSLLGPLDWKVIDWPPSGRRNVAIVFDKPEGGRLFASLGETVAPPGDEVVIRDYVSPIVAALRALSMAGIAHGAVNPTNLLFPESPRQRVVLGECVSTATAVRQPAIFLPIEAALAAPAARGNGQLTDDIFALGVTVAFLVLGGNPVSGLADEAVLRARIELGSYGAIIGDRRLSAGLIDLVRGLVVDDAKLRWTIDEIEEWITTRRFVLHQGAAMRRATRPFEFDGHPYLLPRALSHAFAGNIDAASKALRGKDFENWVQRALDDETTIALIKSAQAETATSSPGDLRDAAFVSRICVALDWKAPIRYRGLAATPDGLGGALASAFLENRSLQTIGEAISQRLPQFWLAARSSTSTDHVALLKLFERLRPLLADQRLGCGVERVLYELNPWLHCLSPLIEKDHVYSLTGLLAALERQAASHLEGGDLIDRHIAAFVAARFKTATSGWVEGLASRSQVTRLVSTLRVLTRLQANGGPAAVPNLMKWVVRQTTPLIDGYHHRPTRDRLSKQCEMATQSGKLVNLMLLIDNPVEQQRDAEGFAEARRAHAIVAGQLSRLAASAARRPQEAADLAGEMAAGFATLVACGASLAVALVLG